MPRICKSFDITIYSNSVRSEQFLKQTAFSTCSWRFLRSNTLGQLELEFKLKKNNWGIIIIIGNTSHENSNHGRKITENLGFKSLLRKIKFFLSFFIFIFKFSIKNRISLFLTIFEYLVLQIRYQ
jgi:hypothetical protein